MSWTRLLIAVPLLLGSALCTTGCYYKAQNFGYTREIRFGRIGCQVGCQPCVPSPPTSPSAEAGSEAEPAPAAKKAVQEPALQITAESKEPPALSRNAEPPVTGHAEAGHAEAGPPVSTMPSSRTALPEKQRKGWVGLPDF